MSNTLCLHKHACTWQTMSQGFGKATQKAASGYFQVSEDATQVYSQHLTSCTEEGQVDLLSWKINNRKEKASPVEMLLAFRQPTGHCECHGADGQHPHRTSPSGGTDSPKQWLTLRGSDRMSSLETENYVLNLRHFQKNSFYRSNSTYY